MAEDSPPWALTDATGNTLLGLGVQTADGAMQPIVCRGSSLPTKGEVLLTTSTRQARALCISVLVGARPAAAACRILGSIMVPLEARDRGLAQVVVRITATLDRVHVTAQDAPNGQCVELELFASSVGETVDGVDAPLPALWRFETPYTDQPHPGFSISGRHYVGVPPEAERSAGDDTPRRVDADGEVAPESTASRVWPGAYVLLTHLQRAGVLDLLRGSRVIECGAGIGVPGLAAAALGASRVLLTDLEENLPRLRAAVRANARDDGTVAVAALDWCVPLPPTLLSPLSYADGVGAPTTIILAADCVFWPSLFGPLLDTLNALLAAASAHGGSAHVLLTVTSRLGRAELFETCARDRGWTVEEMELADGSRSFLHTRLVRLYREAGARDAYGVS